MIPKLVTTLRCTAWINFFCCMHLLSFLLLPKYPYVEQLCSIYSFNKTACHIVGFRNADVWWIFLWLAKCEPYSVPLAILKSHVRQRKCGDPMGFFSFFLYWGTCGDHSRLCVYLDAQHFKWNSICAYRCRGLNAENSTKVLPNRLFDIRHGRCTYTIQTSIQLSGYLLHRNAKTNRTSKANIFLHKWSIMHIKWFFIVDKRKKCCLCWFSQWTTYNQNQSSGWMMYMNVSAGGCQQPSLRLGGQSLWARGHRLMIWDSFCSLCFLLQNWK